MSFNMYLLLFLPKNSSYKRKEGNARTIHYRPLTIHCYYIIIFNLQASLSQITRVVRFISLAYKYLILNLQGV